MPTLGPYCRPAGRGRQQSAVPGKIGIFLIEDGHAHRIGDADDLLNHRPQRLDTFSSPISIIAASHSVVASGVRRTSVPRLLPRARPRPLLSGVTD